MKNISKTVTASFIIGFASLTFASGAHAVEPGLRNLRQEIRNTVASSTGTIRKEINMELKKETQELRKNIIDTVKDKIKNLLPHRIHGTIASIAGDKTSLTVNTDTGTVTVYVSSKTLFKRRFGGNSSLSEFAVGDEVAVIGSQHISASSSSSSTVDTNAIDARYIRDLSIQRRNTVFVGKITSMGTDNFTVETMSRGTQTVYVVPATVITQKDTKISFTDLKVGDRVLVKGEIWDRALNTIDAARIMKLPTVPASGSSSSATTSSSSSSSTSSSVSSQASSSSVI